MIDKKILKMMLLLCVSWVYAAEKERPLTFQEIGISWRLFILIKFFPENGDKIELTKNVKKLLELGAQPTVFFRKETTALSLAQQKKLENVVKLMEEKLLPDPLQPIWNEFEKRYVLKPIKNKKSDDDRKNHVGLKLRSRL